MAKKPTTTTEMSDEIIVEPLKQGVLTLRVIGIAPMFQNRMANKAWEVLLVGGQKKTAADKAEIKHNPLLEFRASSEPMYDGPTALGVQAVGFKHGMADSAKYVKGLAKTDVGRLITIETDIVPLYGIPELRMDIVRNSDQNHTPDVRTRAYYPRWCAQLTIRYVTPQLSASSIVNLLVNAGQLVGVGDWRQGKGKGAYGRYRVAMADELDNEWNDIIASSSRSRQLAALDNPKPANEQTKYLLSFFEKEVKRRTAGGEVHKGEAASDNKRVRGKARKQVPPEAIPARGSNGRGKASRI